MPYYLTFKLFFLANFDFYLHALLTERNLILIQNEIFSYNFRFMCTSGQVMTI